MICPLRSNEMKSECVGVDECAPAVLLAGDETKDRECPIVSLTECAQILAGFLVGLDGLLPSILGPCVKPEQEDGSKVLLPSGGLVAVDQ